MSTQYEFMKRQVVEEVAALQEKLIAIQADCINRIKEIPVTSDLEDTMDELLNKISNQFLFQIEEPESASVVRSAQQEPVIFPGESRTGFETFSP